MLMGSESRQDRQSCVTAVSVKMALWYLARWRMTPLARRLTPQLTGVREETQNNNYSLVLEFKIKKDMTEKMWTDRQSKIQTFFGPGVTADIEFPSEQEVHVFLTTDGRSVQKSSEQY